MRLKITTVKNDGTVVNELDPARLKKLKAEDLLTTQEIEELIKKKQAEQKPQEE